MEIHGHLWSFVLPKMYICVTLKIACPFFQDRRCDFPKRDMPFLKNAHAILNQLLIPLFLGVKKFHFWPGKVHYLRSHR